MRSREQMVMGDGDVKSGGFQEKREFLNFKKINMGINIF